LVITVDGPAAAGKSTVARRLARRLGFRYLDTGAMYRAATWKAMQAGVDMADPAAVAAVAESVRIDLVPDGEGLRVLCDGEDVSEAIRTPEVTENIYHVADPPAARRPLIDQQRRFGAELDLVAEGRDQGTDVFPDAAVKFYLDASLEERARRRLADMACADRPLSRDDVERQVADRDERDRSRPIGALRMTDEMVFIDSTQMSVDEVVEAMAAEIARRGLVPGLS
jgi:cytidylate kinase